jgi:hypothetical protein
VEVLIGLVFLGASLAVAFVLPVISFLRASQANQRSEALGREIQALRAELAALRAGGISTGAATQAQAPAAHSAWVAEVREMAGVRDAAVGPPPVIADGEAASSSAAPDAAHLADIPHDVADAPRVTSGLPHVSTDAAHVAAGAPHAAADSPHVAVDLQVDGHDSAGAPPPLAPPQTAGPGLAATAPSREPGTGYPLPGRDSLEERIGARWLLYAGIGALILGVSYFVKFAFDNGWVSEPLRVLTGLLAGAALVAAGQRFVQRGLAFFGHTLSGGGIVVLYIAIYAALHVYGLIAPPVAFTAMVAVTLLASTLADRHALQVLGVLAVVGGFATPALVGGGQDAQVVLFTYNAILLAGALVLVARHAWAGVAVTAYLLATLAAIVWADDFYTPAAAMRTLLFLTVHLALVMAMVVVLRRQRERAVLGVPATWLLLSAPVLYHMAALMLVGRSSGRLLVYLLVATVAGLSASYHAGWRWARTALLALVALPFIAWLAELQAPRWYFGAVVTACALYLLHLAGQWRDLSDDDPAAPVPISELVHTHATGLFLPLALYVFFEDRFAWWNAPMLTALAAWNGGLAALVWRRVPLLAWQLVALAGTLAALAISEWFDGPVVAIGWALEGAALGHAALRIGSPWLDRASLVLFVLSAVRLVDALVSPMPVGTWPVLNTRALAAAIIVGAMAWLAARVKETPAHLGGPAVRHALIVGAHILAVGWISAEITLIFVERAYSATAAGAPAGAARAELAQQVALSIAWALYAVGLVAAGFRRDYAPARYLAIALFALTLLKVMAKDIAELDRVYQMLSVLVVGALLVAASYLYQRMAARAPDA